MAQIATPVVSMQRIVVMPVSRSVSVINTGPPGPAGPQGPPGPTGPEGPPGGSSDFVNITGDTMTGILTTPGVLLPNGEVEARLLALESGGAGGMPAGAIVAGPWDVDPDGYFILDARTITDGAIDYPALAGFYPDWVSGDDLILPDGDGLVLLADLTANPGLVIGSMSVILSTAQMPVHLHSAPIHQHPIPHTHTLSLTGGGHNHSGRYLTTATGSGGNADLLRPFDATFTYEGQSTTTTGTHSHTGTSGASSNANSSNNAAANTGNAGSGDAIDITPKHITVRFAVKT